MLYNLRNNFFITPTYYSIGNAAEEIYWGLLYSSIKNKKLKIINPYLITESLNYRICNKTLFSKLKGEYLLNCESNYEKIIELYYNLKFLVKRFINNNISYDFPESWSFPTLNKSIFFSIDGENK